MRSRSPTSYSVPPPTASSSRLASPSSSPYASTSSRALAVTQPTETWCSRTSSRATRATRPSPSLPVGPSPLSSPCASRCRCAASPRISAHLRASPRMSTHLHASPHISQSPWPSLTLCTLHADPSGAQFAHVTHLKVRPAIMHRVPRRGRLPPTCSTTLGHHTPRASQASCFTSLVLHNPLGFTALVLYNPLGFTSLVASPNDTGSLTSPPRGANMVSCSPLAQADGFPLLVFSTSLLVAGAIGVALAVTSLGVMLTIIGSICSTSVSFIVPGGCYVLLFHEGGWTYAPLLTALALGRVACPPHRPWPHALLTHHFPWWHVAAASDSLR